MSNFADRLNNIKRKTVTGFGNMEIIADFNEAI